MATRRIARGRGGSPVPIIILSVLLVFAVALDIVLGLRTNELDEQVAHWKSEVDKERQNARNAAEKGVKFKTLVGIDYDNMKGNFDDLKAEWLKKAVLKDTGQAEPRKLDKVTELIDAYTEEVAYLRNELKKLERQLTAARGERDQAITEKGTSAKADSERVERHKKTAEDLRGEKAKLQTQLDDTRKKLGEQIAALDGEKTDLTKEVNKWKKTAEVRGRTIDDLKKQIDDLKHPPKQLGPLVAKVAGEPIDGRVLRVEPDGKHVMIDAGRRDWVQIGMEFEVYDHADPETRKAKGHIQVSRVFDTIAQCKVRDQDELDPILPQMVIVNPAFQRGRTLNFVLVGEFREANIEQFLSRYPCRVVRANATEDGKVTRETDYVVLGEEPIPAGQPRPEDSPSARKAKEWGLTIMKERDLLRYLGELG